MNWHSLTPVNVVWGNREQRTWNCDSNSVIWNLNVWMEEYFVLVVCIWTVRICKQNCREALETKTRVLAIQDREVELSLQECSCIVRYERYAFGPCLGCYVRIQGPDHILSCGCGCGWNKEQRPVELRHSINLLQISYVLYAQTAIMDNL